MSFYLSTAQRGISSPFDSLIEAAASQFGVEVALIKGIISVESGWNPSAVNYGDPFYGLMQLNANYFTTSDGSPITDPQANIFRGSQLLASLFTQFGPDEGAVISAYNAGHPITAKAPYV